MRKYVVAAVAAGIVVFALYLVMYNAEQRKNKEILEKFKEAEAQLDSLKNANPGSNSGVGAIQGSISITSRNSSSILLIDSLVELFEKKQLTRPQLKGITTDLLNNMQEVNSFKWSAVDSTVPDTIAYWNMSTAFTYQKWLDQYFIKNGSDSSIAYLKKLKAEIIRNNY